MNTADYNSTARALASPQESNRSQSPILPVRGSQSPIWTRRSLESQHARNNHTRPRTLQQQFLGPINAFSRRTTTTWNRMKVWQRIAATAFVIQLIVVITLMLVYRERIFAWLGPARHRWRSMPAGWLILWAMTFGVSFPPLIGYSTCVTIAGFVFGMSGWFIVASATVLGSTAAFVVSRTLLRGFVGRLTEKNKEFAALSLVLKHDGLKLLCMIRLCPLPYSFANGAISTIPSVTWPNFMLATAIASPKLLLHIFVGSRLGELAEHGDKMDTKTKVVSYVTIVLGVALGVATGYIIYVRTKARAKVLEAEEAAAAVNGPRTSDAGTDYIDDPDEQEAVDILRQDDDISLPTYDDDLEAGYRDEFTDEEDARERDVFEIGDGDDDVEPGRKRER